MYQFKTLRKPQGFKIQHHIPASLAFGTQASAWRHSKPVSGRPRRTIGQPGEFDISWVSVLYEVRFNTSIPITKSEIYSRLEVERAIEFLQPKQFGVLCWKLSPPRADQATLPCRPSPRRCSARNSRLNHESLNFQPLTPNPEPRKPKPRNAKPRKPKPSLEP